MNECLMIKSFKHYSSFVLRASPFFRAFAHSCIRALIRVHPRSSVVIFFLLIAAISLTGCGPHNYLNDNDKLRASNLHLKRQVEQLQHQLQRREGEIKSMRSQLRRGSLPIAGAVPPRLSKIKLGQYSAAVDTNHDGTDDMIRVYLRTLDQQGRFLPVSGKATLQAAAIEPDEPVKILADHTYTPEQFSDAYRSSFTGTHYTLEAPLPKSLPRDLKYVTVKVTLMDGATGAKFTAQEGMSIQ